MSGRVAQWVAQWVAKVVLMDMSVHIRRRAVSCFVSDARSWFVWHLWL